VGLFCIVCDSKMIVVNLDSVRELSKLLKWHRKRSKLSQQELADIAQIGRASVQRLEKGEQFEFVTLLKIMDILNLTLLIDGPLIKNYKDTHD
jgi:HTH-type transcriptional regulator/antitoxin HipB